MAQQLQNGKQQFFNANGVPLAGGSVAFYLPGTLIPVNTYQDSGLTALNSNPITLDAGGSCVIWGADGTLFRQIVKDSLGNTIWDQAVGDAPINGVIANLSTLQSLRGFSHTGSTQASVSSYYAGGTTGGGIFSQNSSDTSSGWYGTGSISGTTLTIATTVNGAPAIGQQINYSGSDGSVYTTAGSGTSWTLNKAPGTIATTTMTGDNGGSVIVALDGMRWDRETDILDVLMFGAKGDGVTNDTNAIQAAMNAAKKIYFPTSTYVYTALTIPTGISLIGDGPYQSILFLQNASNPTAAAIQNTGGTGIAIQGIGFNGNYKNQSSGDIVSFTNVTNTIISQCEFFYGYNTGLTFSGGNNNVVKDSSAYTNGKSAAGYGIYIYNSSGNIISDCIVYDNCIGVAIESASSGAANDNRLSNIYAYSNRADFSQSGAGIHIESASGNTAYRNKASNCSCLNSTGTGVTLSGVGVDSTEFSNLTSVGNNHEGIVSISTTNLLVANSHIVNNGAGQSSGYQACVRCDDSGITAYSSGIFSNCRIYGTGTGVSSVKTFTTGSSVKFEKCDLSGSTSGAGTLSSANDTINQVGGTRFFANLTSASVTASAIIICDSAVVSDPQYDTSTGIFTCVNPGTYFFSGTGLNDATTVGVAIRKNSAIYASSRIGGISGTSVDSAEVSAILTLTNGDTVDFYCFSGAVINGAGNTFFTGYKVA